MVPSPVFTACNLIVDGRRRHYVLRKGVYLIMPYSTINEPMRIELFDRVARMVSAEAFNIAEPTEDLVATDALPGPTFGTPIGFVGCMISFDGKGEIVL